MVEHLTAAKNLPAFNGHRTRVQCFLHILNLVAKGLIRQFDARTDKEKAEQNTEERLLAKLAADLQANEETGEVEVEEDLGGAEDNPDDEVDPLADLTLEERAQFEINVRPVKLVIAKVSLMHRHLSAAC